MDMTPRRRYGIRYLTDKEIEEGLAEADSKGFEREDYLSYLDDDKKKGTVSYRWANSPI
jgi:hypothetical protein